MGLFSLLFVCVFASLTRVPLCRLPHKSTFDDTGRFACYLNRMVGGMRMALHAHPDGHGEKGIGSDGSTQGRRRVLAITVWYLTPRYELRPFMLGVFPAVRETGAEVAQRLLQALETLVDGAAAAVSVLHRLCSDAELDKEVVAAIAANAGARGVFFTICLLYTSPSPRDRTRSRMPSSA